VQIVTSVNYALTLLYTIHLILSIYINLVHANNLSFKNRYKLMPLMCFYLYIISWLQILCYKHHRELISTFLDNGDRFYLSNDKSKNGFTYSYADNYAFEHKKTNNNNHENSSSPNEFNETVSIDYPLFIKTIIENNEIFDIKKF